MTQSQFQVVVEMFAQQGRRIEALSQRIDDIRQELKEDIKKQAKKQEALSHEIVRIMGAQFAEFEQSFIATRNDHERRISTLEQAASRP